MASTASERMCQGLVFVGIVVITFLIIIPYFPVTSTLIQPVLIGLGIFCVFVALMLYLSIFQFKYGRAVLVFIIRSIAWLIPPFRKRWDLENLPAHLDDWHKEFRAFEPMLQAKAMLNLMSPIRWTTEIQGNSEVSIVSLEKG